MKATINPAPQHKLSWRQLGTFCTANAKCTTYSKETRKINKSSKLEARVFVPISAFNDGLKAAGFEQVFGPTVSLSSLPSMLPSMSVHMKYRATQDGFEQVFWQSLGMARIVWTVSCYYRQIQSSKHREEDFFEVFDYELSGGSN